MPDALDARDESFDYSCFACLFSQRVSHVPSALFPPMRRGPCLTEQASVVIGNAWPSGSLPDNDTAHAEASGWEAIYVSLAGSHYFPSPLPPPRFPRHLSHIAPTPLSRRRRPLPSSCSPFLLGCLASFLLLVSGALSRPSSWELRPAGCVPHLPVGHAYRRPRRPRSCSWPQRSSPDA